MVDAVLISALVWLAREIAAKGLDRLLDRAIDGPTTTHPATVQRSGLVAAPIRRHNLSGSLVPTSDIDVVVQHQAYRFARMPVLLTFQQANQSAEGVPFPMVLTETAHVTLLRGHYLITALVLGLPGTPEAKPTLRSIGWVRPWIASNGTEKISIPGQPPTEELVSELGLTRPDGSALFTLPPKAKALPPAAPVGPTSSTYFRSQAQKPAAPVFDPKPHNLPLAWTKRDFTAKSVPKDPPPATPIVPPRFLTGRPQLKLLGGASKPLTRCRARIFGAGPCPNLAASQDLCPSHLLRLQLGSRLFAYDTGAEIFLAKPEP